MQPAKLSRFSPYLGLAIGLLSLGLAAIFVYWADAPGSVNAFYRMGIALMLATLPFLRRQNRNSESDFKKGIPYAVTGGMLFGLELALWSEGIKMSSATNPTLMVNTAPVWVGLGAWLVFKEKLSWSFWVGLVIALVGVTLVLVEDIMQAADVGVGTFLGLLAAIFYGAYFLITQRGRLYLNTISYFWIASLSGFMLLTMFNILFGIPLTGYSAFTYLNLLALGIFVHFIGWMALNYAQGYLPATIVSPTLLGQPVLVAFFASILIGETFTARQVIGGTLVMAGVFIVYRSRTGKINNVKR